MHAHAHTHAHKRDRAHKRAQEDSENDLHEVQRRSLLGGVPTQAKLACMAVVNVTVNFFDLLDRYVLEGSDVFRTTHSCTSQR